VVFLSYNKGFIRLAAVAKGRTYAETNYANPGAPTSFFASGTTTTYAYNSNGNLTGTTGAATSSITWDYRNRINRGVDRRSDDDVRIRRNRAARPADQHHNHDPLPEQVLFRRVRWCLHHDRHQHLVDLPRRHARRIHHRAAHCERTGDWNPGDSIHPP
jgi:YD repeat-containing protein